MDASAQAMPNAAVTQTVAAVVRFLTSPAFLSRKTIPATMKPTPAMMPWITPWMTRLKASG